MVELNLSGEFIMFDKALFALNSWMNKYNSEFSWGLIGFFLAFLFIDLFRGNYFIAAIDVLFIVLNYMSWKKN